jgi:DNA-binding transcriptional ArsR family regulator
MDRNGRWSHPSDRLGTAQQTLHGAPMGDPFDEAVLAALRQPTPIALLVALERGGEQTPEELAAALGITEGQVHQHVARLHELGVVTDGARANSLKGAEPGWARVAGHLRRLQRRRERDGAAG